MELDQAEPDSNFNVYVGSDTGVFKGNECFCRCKGVKGGVANKLCRCCIYFGHETPRMKNFHTFDELSDSIPIAGISWVDDTQKEILVAFKTGTIKVYNTKLRAFTSSIKLASEGEVVGVFAYENAHLVGLEDGDVHLWNPVENKSSLKYATGKNLSTIRHCPSNKHIFATGGNENDLKVWKLGNPTVPIFSAKNVPHDFLDLRAPIWVQDIAFLPESSELVAVCTRYGQVRLYDPKVNNKGRPVINMEFMDHPLMAISTTRNNRQVLVGSSQGKMGLLDIRNGNKGNVVHHLGGFSGSIRSIAAHPESPYIVSCGLDRHLYLHHLDQKKPLKKLFLKSKLNCVLMADHFKADYESTPADTSEAVHWQNIHMEPLNVSSVNSTSGVASQQPETPSISSKKRKLIR